MHVSSMLRFHLNDMDKLLTDATLFILVLRIRKHIDLSHIKNHDLGS